MSLQENDKKFTCITPTGELLSKKDTSLEMFNSHDWEIVHTEVQSVNQIMSRVRCSICGLQRIFIVSDIEDSAKRASQYREKQKLR